jgi:glycerol uptake facilitator-like aquaporin
MIGTLLFQLLTANLVGKPLEVAFCFAGLMYVFRHISGGHLNPAVTMAASISGHMTWSRAGFYVIAQVVGALLGALLQGGLIPHAQLGHHLTGCLRPELISSKQLFGWEILLTAFFIAAVYASMLGRPGHGDVSPLAAGLALYGCLATGGRYTGYSPLNPARAFATTLVFNCYWNYVWIYLIAEVAGALLAVLWAFTVFGKGPHYTGEPLSAHEPLLSAHEPAGLVQHP